MGCPLNLLQLLSARRVVPIRREQELGVDVYDREKIVQLVGNETGRLCCILEASGLGQVRASARQGWTREVSRVPS